MSSLDLTLEEVEALLSASYWHEKAIEEAIYHGPLTYKEAEEAKHLETATNKLRLVRDLLRQET